MEATKFNPNDIFTANGLVTVVTGGGTGIGLAFASALLRTNASKIYIIGRRLDVLKSAASSLDSTGNIVIPLQCDVTDIESVKAAAERVRQEIGYVDVLINNAGVSGPNHKAVYDAERIEDVQKILFGEWDKWETTFAINTTAVMGVTTAFLDLLDKANARRGYELGKKERGGGIRERKSVDGIAADDVRSSQVITVASIAAFNRFMTAGMAYSASKAGAVAIGKSLATFLAPWGIRSNIIAPGIFPSEMTEGVPPEFAYDLVPAHRQGNFNEIAGTLLYMVGKSGAYLNGSVQLVDGGRLSVFESTY